MPIRDLLILGIVVTLAIWTLRRPWIGVMNWTWLSIMNPHRYSWGFAYSFPVAAIAGAATLLALLFTKDKRSPFLGAPTWWLFSFALWVTASWLLGMDVEGDYPQWDKVLKIYLMTFVALALLHTKYQIMVYAWVTIGSLAFLAAKGGVFTIITAGNYRVWGPAGSFIGDNNHFALAVIVSLPMLHFLQLQLTARWARYGMAIVMLLCAAAAVGSHSRGALLALLAVGVVFWWRSRQKRPIALAIVLGVLVFLPMMPEHWWGRMASIANYQEDASAMGRINAWYVAWDVAKSNFFGAGMSYQHPELFLQYGRFETTVRAAHSIYFQIMGNHGFIGLFLYLMIWISSFRTAGWLRKNALKERETKWVADLGAMAQASLIGYAVGGAFLSMPYFDLPYNIMVMLVLAKVWVTARAWEATPAVALPEHAVHESAATVGEERGRRKSDSL